jgi:sigma-B regulation protein RsbU (phosphoserine phosphatase)
MLGDVAGHDLDAAIQTAAAKYFLRAYAERTLKPGSVVRRLNDALMNQFEAPAFISLFYGIIDLKNDTLHYANAGHEPPQLLLPGEDGGEGLTPTLLDQSDALLAVQEGEEYRDFRADFPPGAILAIYTDGLTEARRGEEFLLTEGVTRMLTECPKDSAQGLADALWGKVREYEDQQRDDAAILILRRQ